MWRLRIGGDAGDALGCLRDAGSAGMRADDARLVRTINRIDQRNRTVWNIKDNGLDDGTAPILPSTWTIV